MKTLCLSKKNITLNKRKNILLVVTLIFLTNMALAQEPCEPFIQILENESDLIVKEGRVGTIVLERDRLCPGQEIYVQLEFLDGTAIRGVNYQAERFEYAVFKNTFTTAVRFEILNNEEWDEGFEFYVRLRYSEVGTVKDQTITIRTENANPLVKLDLPRSLKEPREGSKTVPLRVFLNQPAEFAFEGKLRIVPVSATYMKDYVGPSPDQLLTFFLLEGDNEFIFPEDKLIKILADDEKENPEDIMFIIESIDGTKPDKYVYDFTILDFQDNDFYRIKFNSNISLGEPPVTIEINYSIEIEARPDNESGQLENSNITSPRYKYIIKSPEGEIPQPKTEPGNVVILNIANNDNSLESLLLKFDPSPQEILPYVPMPQYLFMSTFGLLHQSQMQSSGNAPTFLFQNFSKVNQNSWKKEFNRTVAQDDGSIKENTTIEVQIIESD